MEQILSLRLLIDYCITKKTKLFIVFVDFRKAYDNVPRHNLLECLKERGCGRTMILAIQAMYQCTKYVLRSAIISATIGVRQGATTSCLLFVLYIDNLARAINSKFAEDGFLGALHLLLLMDDTEIMATTKLLCIDKVKTLIDFCHTSGMQLNEQKTKVMVINGSQQDKAPLHIQDGLTIAYTAHYRYLGAHFTDDGRLSSVVELHARDCVKQANKFAIFTRKNSSMPYHLKKQVLDAALISSMLYGCETWLCKDIKPIGKHYMACIKTLLGVRASTTNLLCLLESGYPELESMILKRRINFITTFTRRSSGEEPLHRVIDICKAAITKGYRMLQQAIDYIGDPVTHNHEQLKARSHNKRIVSTKTDTYLRMNPGLILHNVYKDTGTLIRDYQRVSFTRLRLSAHRLRVETGRWTRTPREARLCRCELGEIQDEEHVIFKCPLTKDIRDSKTCIDTKSNKWDNLFSSNAPILCEMIHDTIMKFT